ncbi:YHYH protein [Hoeflea sp. WL0058]|uniref:YHYH protein n=1 Tax=Flavimaribacter sediminis TaxID=2865987 RepID=A0AAE3D279_9HYPH|nr:YHYH protein [Flavimaribacter sediminis]MBW8638586.1 YHYH protein [Flavimaribacter sediminis]
MHTTSRSSFFQKSRPLAVVLGGVALFSSAGASAEAHELPLGDGKISNRPKSGYVFSCQQRFNPNAGGAHASGSWLGRSTYDPDLKPTVSGSVSWPAELRISLEGQNRVVRSNTLPKTLTGRFPIRPQDKAFAYDRNPARIVETDIVYSMPASPSVAGRSYCVPMGMIGITVTNTAIFNALDGRGEDAPAHEIQDACSGHPERNGLYHFHNMSPCIRDTRSGPAGHSNLIGYALDGFGIYGKYGEGGKRMTNADLDECHGHTGTVTWDSEEREIYHYHMTDEYPYTVGCFRGAPATLPASLSPGRGGPRAGMRRPPPGGFGRPPRQP